MSDYLSYLKESSADSASRRRQRSANTQAVVAMIQQIKNASAPTISGSSGSASSAGPFPNGQQVQLGSTTSWNGKVGKVVGGKAMPIAGGKWGYAYGSRNSRYASGRHTGWDISIPNGTPVRAAAGGVVSYTGFNRGGYGNYVKVKHADGTTSLYGHNSSFRVKAGQKVKPGQVIAMSGNTGNSSGPHLHFEVRRVDKYGGDVNPRSWLATR